VLLNSRVTALVISLEFARKNKFKKKKMDSTFNYEEPIEYTMEIELFYKEYKERMEMDIIGGQIL